MRHRDQNGQDWADIIDFLTMYPEALRRLAWDLTTEEGPTQPGGAEPWRTGQAATLLVTRGLSMDRIAYHRAGSRS
jgi:hypothetical protein